MAGFAFRAAGVLRRDYLRKLRGLSGIGVMAAPAKTGNLERRRACGRGIFCMTRQRTMARLARHARVPPLAAQFNRLRVACPTCLLSGERESMLPVFHQGGAAVVAILAEALRNHRGAEDEKRGDATQKDQRQQYEMRGISKLPSHGRPFREFRRSLAAASLLPRAYARILRARPLALAIGRWKILQLRGY
jgi:hypothetical protein